MRSILAATSSVLSAAAAAAAAAAEFGPFGTVWTGPVLCVFLFHGLRYQILCWTLRCSPCSSQLTHPSASRGCLSFQTCLSVIMTSSISSQATSAHLLLFLYSLSVSTSVWLLLFLFFFVFHLYIACLSASFWSSACTWQMKTSTWAFTKDDSFDKFQTLIKGLSFKHCCLCETNNYCQLKLSGFHCIFILVQK